MLKEFKKFITEGNVMDLAVAVIMGAAVKEMVDGLINGLIAPLIGAATAGVNMKEMAVTIAGVKLQYGLFLDALVKFIIIAFVVFLMLKLSIKVAMLCIKNRKLIQQQKLAHIARVK